MSEVDVEASPPRPREPAIGHRSDGNVVVCAVDEATTVVEAFGPDAMIGLSGDGGLDSVAADARQRLTAMVAAFTEEK